MSDSHEQVGFVAPDPADLAPLFPGYDIQGLIATGGMGAVYRAVQRSLDRTVALKILPMEFSKDAAFCAGFEAEAKAMARLNHPNLIGVFDFGEVNGMLFIIMEYVPGQSVYHSAYGTAIDQKEVIRLVAGICDGLAHAHENGIIHRDIKPSNILLDLNAQPKIGDFGLARPADRQIEEGEEIFGTPHYTAPEVVNAPHSVDYRADIFSVGVLLHELLTGKLPAQDPRPPSAVSRCDARFDKIVKKATMPLAAARFASAAEISKELRAIGAALEQKVSHVPSAAAPRRVAPVKTYGKKSQGSGSSTVVFLVLAAAIGAGAYFFFSKPTPAEAPKIVETPPPAPKVEKPVETPVVPRLPEPKVAEKTPEPQPEASGSAFGSSEAPLISGESSVAPSPGDAEPAVDAKFDVAGYLGKGRKNLQDRAKPLISTYRLSLSGNNSSFLRETGNLLRKMKLSGESVDKSVENAVGNWKGKDGKIPRQLDGPLSKIPGIDTVHAQYLQLQTGIDDTFQQGLSSHSSTYVQGIDKKIESLKAENDPGAITLLEREIKKTKESPKYFADLMLGADPQSGSGDD
ncbi:protein kinase [Luteolibacter yonseiensis]|uniref:Protein kinase n=1 Tax=Luteolibacter yonseiensis TaxID=1144680 RepID=A0A934V9Q7_9BACT|nr:serine/threonine-protein kinase [Luteolibacter yonseiensis]MBK1815408.1 protein kinase [Luteolibacter yonseiensis]